MKSFFIAVSLSAISLGACVSPVSGSSAKGNFGAIEYGEKFGVKVGVSRGQAIAVLKKQNGISLAASESCAQVSLPGGGKCATGGLVDTFLVARLSGNGVIYVVTLNDAVVSIAWSLSNGPVL